MSIELETAAGAATLLRGFIGLQQLSVLGELCRGDEGQFFRAKLVELAGIIANMPQTYGQDGKGDDAIAYLHYFTSGCDWWITEKDVGSVDDSPAEFQWQAFGVANLGYGPERGYICLPELLSAGAELDLHFTPSALRMVKGAV